MNEYHKAQMRAPGWRRSAKSLCLINKQRGYRVRRNQYGNKDVVIVCDKGHSNTLRRSTARKFRQCPQCSPLRPKTSDEITTEMKRLGWEYVSGNLTRSWQSSNIVVKHIACGSCKTLSRANYLKKRPNACKSCLNVHRQKISEEIKEQTQSIRADRKRGTEASRLRRWQNKVGADGYTLIGGSGKSGEYLTLKCPHNHIWECLPRVFHDGSRCPHCLLEGKERSRPYTCYYLRVRNPQNPNAPYYKAGITARSVAYRFSRDNVISYTVLHQHKEPTRLKALQWEKGVLAQHKDKRVGRIGGNQLKGIVMQGGYSELFTDDVLNLEGEQT